jgi:two-component system phosphate regulon sensor histidine kinase PhoR
MSLNDDWLENLRFVAHEMKTPIGAIKGFIELATAAGPLTDKQVQFLNRVLASSQRLERLVELMLEAARVDTGKPLTLNHVNLAAVIQHDLQLLESMAAQMNVTVHEDISSSVGLIWADQERLSIVISNLISNSIKYNQVGGEVWVQAYGDDETVVVSVRDTGRGVREEERDNIFRRFYRVPDPKRKIEGTGLGLYIVKSLIEMHGGTITLDSEVGIGSTFTVTLPRTAASKQTTTASEGSSAVAVQGTSFAKASKNEG